MIEAAKHPAVKELQGQSKMIAHGWLIGEIERLFKYLNFQESKLPEQETVADWAMDLMDQYNYLSLEEFAVFFRMARKGNIELEMFERLGYDVIKAAIDKYVARRQRKIKEREEEERKTFDVSNYAASVLETIRKGAPAPEAKKVVKTFSTMSYAKEIADLKASIPTMELEALKALQYEYKKLSNTGRDHEAVGIIQAEIDGR